MSDDVTIRPARDADFDDLIALLEEFHAFMARGVPTRLRLPEPSDGPAEGERGQAWMREQLRAITRDSSAALLLAEAEGQVVALAEVCLRRDEPSPWTVQHTYGYLQSLVATARWRRRGVGKRLVAAAEAWARERGATQLRLDTWEFAAGPLRFYEALGYEIIKRALMKPLA